MASEVIQKVTYPLLSAVNAAELVMLTNRILSIMTIHYVLEVPL